MVPVTFFFLNLAQRFDKIVAFKTRYWNEHSVGDRKVKFPEHWFDELPQLIEFCPGPLHCLHLVDENDKLVYSLTFDDFKLFQN